MHKCISEEDGIYCIKATKGYVTHLLYPGDIAQLPNSELAAIVATNNRGEYSFRFLNGTEITIWEAFVGVGETIEESVKYEEQIEIWRKLIEYGLVPQITIKQFMETVEKSREYREQLSNLQADLKRKEHELRQIYSPYLGRAIPGLWVSF